VATGVLLVATVVTALASGARAAPPIPALGAELEAAPPPLAPPTLSAPTSRTGEHGILGQWGARHFCSSNLYTKWSNWGRLRTAPDTRANREAYYAGTLQATEVHECKHMRLEGGTTSSHVRYGCYHKRKWRKEGHNRWAVLWDMSFEGRPTWSSMSVAGGGLAANCEPHELVNCNGLRFIWDRPRGSCALRRT